MNFNHPWNGSRGRNRGNRVSGRSWRGGHYRGGSHFHRGVPPMLNSDAYYGPSRFRPHENYSNYYAHSPVSQNEQWNPRNRPSPLSNQRQSFLPHFLQQNTSRSISPLPGSEEYMERNISEKSALLKRQLELEGSSFNIDGMKRAEESVGDFQTDGTNNNFFEEDAYPKESDDGTSVVPSSEVTQSPRRNKKQKPISQSVEEIHQKIINHISNLSYSKKMNLVNLSGPSGYDIALQEITRQKRMELSKALRDMCHNKFKENDDSSQVINSIIPDFDIKIEELPREVVEQLSSTLDEDVTERLGMCIDPELMFQQAAEMLSTTLDMDKSLDDDKVEFNTVNFLTDDKTSVVPVNDNLELKDPMIVEPVIAPNTPSLESCPLPTFNFEMPEPSVFDIPSPVMPQPSMSPEPQCQNAPEDPEVDHSNPNPELYSPGRESSNSSSLPRPNFDLMDIPEPADIPIPSDATAETIDEDIDLLDLNNRGKISFNLNKRVLLKNEEFDGNSSTKDDEEKSHTSVNESHVEEKAEDPPKSVEDESGKDDKGHKGKEHKKDKKDKSKSKEESVAKDDKKIDKEDPSSRKSSKDRKNKTKREEEEDGERKKAEKKGKLRHESEDSQRASEKDERVERRQRDKYAAETLRVAYDDEVVERRKDKKGKSKYDEEYYSSKYERGKFDTYQVQSYEDGYRKRYRESPVVDEDKHRRSDHEKNFERYRELEADMYHYSKYPVDVDDGRNSKRYYHEKSSYRQEYDYPYNKYDYPSSEYYQRSELYPSEDYDPKLQYSKTHKNKYKRHSKKHKRHRDRSSESNASSSGSEKNSSTSSLKTINKHASKQVDLYDSSEEGVINKAPKTSLMERLQVLCDTKLGGIKLEPVSPNPNENEHKRPNSSNDVDQPTSNEIDQFPKEAHLNDQTVSVSAQSSQKSGENATQKNDSSKIATESACPRTSHSKNRSESEDDLKNFSEVDSFESKKYSQRPWKSPGEKKSYQNAPDEDGVELEDIECGHSTPPLPESLLQNDSLASEGCTIKGAESHPTEMNKLPSSNEISETVDNVEKSNEFSGLQITDKMLVTTYTQTATDNSEELVVASKCKELTTSFTQTIVTNSTTSSTQTQAVNILQSEKLTQTDHVIIVDNVTETEVDDNVSKSMRCKQFIDRMYEIDKDIDRLVKLRQGFYHLFVNLSDSYHPSEVKDTKSITSSSKSVPKGSRNTPTPNIPERSSSKKKSHTTGHHKSARLHEHSSKTSHHKSDSITNAPEPSKQKSAPLPKERSRRTEPKTSNAPDKQKTTRATETQNIETKEAESVSPKTTHTSDDSSSKLQHHTRGRPRKNQPNTSQSANRERSKDSKDEQLIVEEKKEKVVSLKEKSDGGRKRKLKKDEGGDVEAKRTKKLKMTETSSVEIEKFTSVVEPEEVAPKVDQEARPEDSAAVEDCKSSALEVEDATVHEDKSVTVVDNNESLVEAETQVHIENKLNGSFIGEATEEKEQIKEDLIVEDSVTSIAKETVPVLISAEPSTPSVKKKKRRMSGVMAEYRKKKKKSKKSKKKEEKSVVSKPPVESRVKITRFSLEQLENMRDSIRGRQESSTESSEPNLTTDDKPEESVDLDEIVPTSCENVFQPEPATDESVEPATDVSVDPTLYSIDFKGFTGAILVIKVIENTVLAASDKGQILCFNLLNGELINTVNISTLAVTSLVLTRNNDISTIYAGSLDMQITIFNYQTNEIVKQETLSEPIQCMEHSWNFIFVGSDRGTLIRFDLDTETVMDETKISDTNILMMKASLEGPRKILVVATRNSPISIRDALSGLLLRTMETSFLPTVYTLLIDKNLVYCGTSQHGILVYTFEDGQLALQHEATKSGVVCMQFVGNLLFAGCYNGNIYVYNKKSNTYLGTMNGPGGLMLSMEIVDDTIIVGTKSSNFKAWKIPREYYEEK